MKVISETAAWRQYEAGREYKRRIGLYETVRTNERFYRGEQWSGADGNGLPRPVFNIVRRIADYLICNIASNDLTVTYTDENLPYVSDRKKADLISAGVDAFNRGTAYRWQRRHMNDLIYRLIFDAAVSGDGILYSWWDADADDGRGDIATGTVDNTNLFVSDVNRADIQSQEYIIISCRATVSSLKNEARRCGAPESEIAKIIPDGDTDACELDSDDSKKATYLVKFWREDGRVKFEKSTRGCVIRRTDTHCRLYPISYFSWYPAKNSFHGTAPISSMIPNQKYINRAYAMVMKHMTDSAFSKVIYDRTRIPEWSNEVGEAIGAAGGGNIGDAVAVVGTGQMEDGFLELINNAVSTTKELAGATETALGNIAPNNASAILALREGATVALEQVRCSLYRCIEETADIWADMSCAYNPDICTVRTDEGISYIDFSLLRSSLLHARVEISECARYSLSATQTVLDRLLDSGHITFAEYLDRLPDGILPGKAKLAASRRKAESTAPATEVGADTSEKGDKKDDR